MICRHGGAHAPGHQEPQETEAQVDAEAVHRAILPARRVVGNGHVAREPTEGLRNVLHARDLFHRTCARATRSHGMSGGLGCRSSRYSTIALDSQNVTPSSVSAGTLPCGLGARCSPYSKLSRSGSQASPFSSPSGMRPPVLGGQERAAQVRPAREAELALAALGDVERDHVVAGPETGHAGPDLLDHAAALMAEHGREEARGVA